MGFSSFLRVVTNSTLAIFISIQQLSAQTPVGAASISCNEAISLPPVSGEYAVGTFIHEILDMGIPETTTQSNTADSRSVVYQLWYPSETGGDSAPFAYMPDLPVMLEAMRATGQRGAISYADQISSYGCVEIVASYGPDGLDTSSMPVLLYSPGGNMSRHWFSAQAQEFASHGYVVVMVSHAYSNLDIMPGDQLSGSHQRWNNLNNPNREVAEPLDREISDLLTNDLIFVLDDLIARTSTDSQHPLFDLLDAERIAVLGHSRGGKAVGRSCQIESRISACIVFDNPLPAFVRESAINKPVLSIRSSLSRSERRGLREFLEDNNAPSWDIELESADHYSFSDLPFIDAQYRRDVDPYRYHSQFTKITLDFLSLVWGEIGNNPAENWSAESGVRVWSNQ